MPRKDQPDDEIIGYWRRATLVEMDQRFCERMAYALELEQEQDGGDAATSGPPQNGDEGRPFA
jgi:hypothetical protein